MIEQNKDKDIKESLSRTQRLTRALRTLKETIQKYNWSRLAIVAFTQALDGIYWAFSVITLGVLITGPGAMASPGIIGAMFATGALSCGFHLWEGLHAEFESQKKEININKKLTKKEEKLNEIKEQLKLSSDREIEIGKELDKIAAGKKVPQGAKARISKALSGFREFLTGVRITGRGFKNGLKIIVRFAFICGLPIAAIATSNPIIIGFVSVFVPVLVGLSLAKHILNRVRSKRMQRKQNKLSSLTKRIKFLRDQTEYMQLELAEREANQAASENIANSQKTAPAATSEITPGSITPGYIGDVKEESVTSLADEQSSPLVTQVDLSLVRLREQEESFLEAAASSSAGTTSPRQDKKISTAPIDTWIEQKRQQQEAITTGKIGTNPAAFHDSTTCRQEEDAARNTTAGLYDQLLPMRH